MFVNSIPYDVDLFDPDFNWAALVNQSGPQIAKVTQEICDVLTYAGRAGIQHENGICYQNAEYLARVQIENEIRQKAANAFNTAMEGSPAFGFITPDMTSAFFAHDLKYLPTKEFEPDMSWMDWMTQRRMTQEIEDRKEWDAVFHFARMDQTGQVEYGKFADTETTMRNHEYGAGIAILRTWFETNQFGIKMNSLAPKMRWQYYDQISTGIYALVIAGFVTTIAAVTQNVIRDLNAAAAELKRTANWAGKFPWANSPLRILACPEVSWLVDAALAMNYAMLSREKVQHRFSVTYTSKLPASNNVYVVVDKWEQNEFGVRVPYSIFGKATDIDTFADKMTARGAHGYQLDTDSARVICFDPDDCDFVIGGPIGTRSVPCETGT